MALLPLSVTLENVLTAVASPNPLKRKLVITLFVTSLRLLSDFINMLLQYDTEMF